jgi:SGNH domain-containing protein
MRSQGQKIALVVALVSLVAIGAAVASRAYADSSQAPVTKTVLLVGDSVPDAFAASFAAAAAKEDYVVVKATHPGCPATGVRKVYSSGARFNRSSCPKAALDQDVKVARYRPALVIWWSRYELAPRLGQDGRVLPPGSKPWWRAQKASFKTRTRALTKRGARLVAVQIERPGQALATRNPSERAFLVGQTLLHRTGVVNAWNAFLASHKGPKLFSISIDGLVCHNAADPCDDTLTDGETARPDGVHYSETAMRVLGPQIFDAAWRAAHKSGP